MTALEATLYVPISPPTYGILDALASPVGGTDLHASHAAAGTDPLFPAQPQRHLQGARAAPGASRRPAPLQGAPPAAAAPSGDPVLRTHGPMPNTHS